MPRFPVLMANDADEVTLLDVDELVVMPLLLTGTLVPDTVLSDTVPLP